MTQARISNESSGGDSLEEGTTLIQYLCQYCGDPITPTRPGWLEFYSRVNGVATYPGHACGVHGAVHHDGCGESLADSYSIRVPERLDYLGTGKRTEEYFDSLAECRDTKRHILSKTWCTLWCIEALKRWEIVSRHSSGGPNRQRCVDAEEL